MKNIVGFPVIIKECVRTFLLFCQKLIKSDLTEEQWCLGYVYDELMLFLRYYQMAKINEHAVDDFNVHCFKGGPQNIQEWEIESRNIYISFNKNDLDRISTLIKDFRDVMNEWYESDDVETDYHQFIFSGEERVIENTLLARFVEDPISCIGEYEGTWVPANAFRGNSIKAIRVGEASKPIGKALAIHSIQKRFYYISAPESVTQGSKASVFGAEVLSLAPGLIVKSEKETILNGGMWEDRYRVKSLKANDIESLLEITCSLFVEYFIQYGDFNRLGLCNNCDALFLKAQEDISTFCSTDCYKDYRKKYDAEMTHNCRERQRRWFNIRIERGGVSIPAEKCQECDTSFTHRGGDCPALWNDNKNKIIAWFDVTKHETPYQYMCRKRQKDYFQNRLPNIRRSNLISKRACDDCNQIENETIPDPGTCKAILSKYHCQITNTQSIDV